MNKFFLLIVSLFLALYGLTSCTNIPGETTGTEMAVTIEPRTSTPEVIGTDLVSPSLVAPTAVSPSPTPSVTIPSTTRPPTPLPTVTPPASLQPFTLIKTAVNTGSVTDVALSDDGRYAVIIRDSKLSLYDMVRDEASPIGPNAGQVLSAAISPDGQIVAYWATEKNLNDIPGIIECQNPNSLYCGTLFIYDVASTTTSSVPFGIRVGPGPLAPLFQWQMRAS